MLLLMLMLHTQNSCDSSSFNDDYLGHLREDYSLSQHASYPGETPKFKWGFSTERETRCRPATG